jgi:hypothetical protein
VPSPIRRLAAAFFLLAARPALAQPEASPAADATDVVRPKPTTGPATNSVHAMHGYPLTHVLHPENTTTGYSSAPRSLTGYSGTPVTQPERSGRIQAGTGHGGANASLQASDAPAKPKHVTPLVQIDRNGVPWQFDAEHSAWRNLITGVLTIAPPER